MFFRPTAKRSVRPNRQPGPPRDVDGNKAAPVPAGKPTEPTPACKNPRKHGHCNGCPAHDSEKIGGVVYHWCMVTQGTEPMAYWFRRIRDEWQMKDCWMWRDAVAQMAIDTDKQIAERAQEAHDQQTITKKEEESHEPRAIRHDPPAAPRQNPGNGGVQRKRVLRIRGRQSSPQFSTSGQDELPF